MGRLKKSDDELVASFRFSVYCSEEDKLLVKELDKIAKKNGLNRSRVIIGLVKSFVDKNSIKKNEKEEVNEQ